jgi:hypothetical protein
MNDLLSENLNNQGRVVQAKCFGSHHGMGKETLGLVSGELSLGVVISA